MASYKTVTTVCHPDGTFLTTTTFSEYEETMAAAATHLAAQTAPPGGTVLVPGGAGYIGSHTVRSLVGEGYKVVVIDNLCNGNAESVDPAATFENVDLADLEAVRQVFKRHKPDAVIDFAAFLAVGESMADPASYMQTNVVNFVNVMDAMKEFGCKNIIKSSTSSTYGDPSDPNEFPLKEDYQDRYCQTITESALGNGTANYLAEPKEMEGEEFFQSFLADYGSKFGSRDELIFNQAELRKLRVPMSIYGLTKLMDEIIMAKYEALYGIRWTALRYFNVCGAAVEGDIGEAKAKPATLMTMAIYYLLGKRDKMSIMGTDYPTKDGTAVRDYIHPADLATAHIAALRLLQRTGKAEVFNLGNGEGSTVKEVLAAVERASGKKIDAAAVPRRSGDPAKSYCDPSRANTILKWRPQFDLDAMAETAWKWHSTHPNGFEGNPK